MSSAGKTDCNSTIVIVSDLAGRQHDPDDARRFKLFDQIAARPRLAVGAFAGEPAHRVGTLVVDDAGMAVFHQAAHDVAAHPAETDHTELH